MTARAWLRDVTALAERLGGRVERRSKHLAVLVPGCNIVIASTSPSDHRSWHNLRRDLRHALRTVGRGDDV